MKTIALGRFELDGCYVVGFSHSLEDARLAAGLVHQGLLAKLYSGKPDGRVVDVVRQLVRMRADTYVFWLSPESVAPTIQLVHGLHQINPALSFVFWGSNLDAVALAPYGRCIAASCPETALPLILDFAATSMEPAAFSPYLSGGASKQDVARLGLSIAQDVGVFDRELAWLSGQDDGALCTIPLFGGVESEHTLLGPMKLIGELHSNFEFELHVESADFTDALLDGIAAAGIKKVIVARGGVEASKVASNGIVISQTSTTDELAQRMAQYGRNGSIALQTGRYTDGVRSAAIYHFEVTPSLPIASRQQAYRWAGPNMSIRSAAVLSGPADEVLRQLPERGELSLETEGWPKHLYAIANNGEQGGHVVLDGDRDNAQTVQHVPLSRLATVKRPVDSRTFVSLRTDEDVDELVAQLEMFHKQGRVDSANPKRYVFFENSCRWAGGGACQVSLLRRMSVDENGNLNPCRDGGVVGQVGDSFDVLLTRVKQGQQIEEVRRGCSTCPVRDQCSRCSQVPQEWSGRYCEIRKRYPLTSLYFELLGFPFLVGPYFPASEDDSALTVSWNSLPLQHYNGPVGEIVAGNRPIIVSLLGQHVAWWRGTRRLMRLSSPMAFMAEAWWAGANQSDVEAGLREAFAVDSETSALSYLAGMSKLKEAGIVYG